MCSVCGTFISVLCVWGVCVCGVVRSCLCAVCVQCVLCLHGVCTLLRLGCVGSQEKPVLGLHEESGA